VRCVQSWRDMNPGFEHNVWSKETAGQILAENFGQHAKECFDVCESPASRAALFGAAILVIRGGFVVDPTRMCVRSIAPLAELSAELLLTHAHRGDDCDEGTDFLLWASNPRAKSVGCALTAMLTVIACGGQSACDVSMRFRSILDELLTAEAGAHLNLLDLDGGIFQAQSDTSCGAGSNREICIPTSQSRDELVAFPANAKFGVSRWAPVLFLGHPRCGSKALATGLRSAGLQIGSEDFGTDGVVSWWHTGRRLPDTSYPTFTSGGGKGNKREIWIAGKTVHYIRDPRDAIPSIVLENEAQGRRNNSFIYRRQKLKQKFGIDIGQLDIGTAATTSYALWNQLAGELATHGRIFVERPDFSAVFASVDLCSLPRANTSRQRFGKDKPEIDLADAVARSPAEARRSLEQYIALYKEFGRS